MKPDYFENFNVQKLKSYSLDKIQSAFKSIAFETEIEYNYPQGGCQQRAQIASLLLEKKFKIKHCKIWLFAPSVMTTCNNIMLEIEDKNEFTEGNTIQWGYHVAPVVCVENDGKEELMIIDPAINTNKPVTQQTWLNHIKNSEKGSYTYTTSETYFFNSYTASDGSCSNVFDGTFYNYEEKDQQNLELEKGLAICDTAMHIFHNYIYNTPAKKPKKYIDELKEIFGNATAIDCLVAQNNSANTPNTIARYVVTNYGDVLNAAKTFFNDRLMYWVSVTNDLIK